MTNPFDNAEKMISFCMPCYGNAYKDFERSIKCLVEQDYDNWELVVVFDGPNKRVLRWAFM